jgi:hypothetical protein
MGWYYNKGRGNLPLTLSADHSISIPGNSWIELKGAAETTPSVMRAKNKGQLHRQEKAPKHLRSDPEPAKAEEPEKKDQPKKVESPPAKATPPKAESKKEEVKTPVAGDEAGAPAAPKPKPSTAGKSKKTTKTK